MFSMHLVLYVNSAALCKYFQLKNESYAGLE